MQTVYRYPDEEIKRLSVYAWGVPRSPPVRYGLMHQEVCVPSGCLPIQIAQFARLDPAADHPIFNHWSIFIPTSPVDGIGRYYELAGQPLVHYVGRTVNDYNVHRGRGRGSHTIGYVLPVNLPFLEAHFARVVVRPGEYWDSRVWVWQALQGLNHPHMFAIGIDLGDLVIQMAVVSTAWELGTAR